MSNNQASSNFYRFVTKVTLISILIVWCSSYIQLSVLGDFDAPKSIKQIGYFWFAGLAIDLISLFFTFFGHITKKYMSPLIGIGWLFYFFSNGVYGKPCLFIYYGKGALFNSGIKVVEFLLLSFFHLICVAIIPGFLEMSNERRDLDE